MHLPNPSEGGSFTPPPQGTHLALCTRVIDLGTQHTTYLGKAKTAHKVMLSWELPEERMDDGRPFTVSKRYTWSTHEKSQLRKDLEAWRGAAFKDADFGPGGFDIRNVLGKPCVLGVVHEERNDRVYANVASIGKPMRGMAIPEAPESDPIYLWLDRSVWSASTFDKLSKGLQDTIRTSPEYAELTRQAPHYDGHDSGFPEQTGSDIHDDDIPF